VAFRVRAMPDGRLVVAGQNEVVGLTDMTVTAKQRVLLGSLDGKLVRLTGTGSRIVLRDQRRGAEPRDARHPRDRAQASKILVTTGGGSISYVTRFPGSGFEGTSAAVLRPTVARPGDRA